jgi:Uma2 family endonuclease
MTLPLEKRHYTVAEYLQMEEKAIDKHEYWEGEILAMSGGTYRHGTVSTNCLIALGIRLRGKPCRPLDANMRVRTSAGRYVYPDAQIVCGGPIFDPEDKNQTTITNPSVVIEVLSPSTEDYDRVRKSDAYMLIESLKEYVLIDPRQPLAQTYNRQEDGSWRLDRYIDLNGTLKLRSLGLEIPMTEVYADVEFTTES